MKRATTLGSRCSSYISDFNPRPREEGDQLTRENATDSVYFNPRPREEGDRGFVPRGTLRKSISIHALVKRATDGAKFILSTLAISIHALVKRATNYLIDLTS